MLPKGGAQDPPLTLERMFQHVERAMEYAVGVDREAMKEPEGAPPSKFATLFPDSGPFARRFYKKHMEFIEAGAIYKERLLMKANRVGGTTLGAYETTCHATGLYPSWWKGRRFNHPVEIWACGTTSETTRNIVQVQLVGSIGVPDIPRNEEGMIPAHLVRHTSRRIHGLQGALEQIWVQHKSGGTSTIGLKSYEQGREAFEGTAKHVIWQDEECPEDCYTEMLYRTVTTKGIVIVTFTPLKGRSKVVNSFLDPENEAARESKWYIQVGWDDVPHIDLAERKAVIATTPPYQLKARTEGEPSLGAGAIYPIPASEIRIADFILPPHWPRLFSLDAATSGYTAAVWLALDREADMLYLHREYKRAGAEVPIHAAAIRAMGSWIPGVGDVAGVVQADGTQFLQLYRREGLDIVLADKAVEAGIQDVWELLSTGRLKVFASCQQVFKEYLAYHRDERGKIAKENDHLMDALRMGVRARNRMKTKLEAQPLASTRRSIYTGMPAVKRGWSS
jgi:phage terminase large subunit-like protein